MLIEGWWQGFVVGAFVGAWTVRWGVELVLWWRERAAKTGDTE